MAPFEFPTARDSEQADQLWRATRRYVSDRLGCAIADTRIRVVEWSRVDRSFRAVVGRRFQPAGDVVLAILESPDHYLVCTPGRGFLRAVPLLVGKAEVTSRELFDPPGPTPRGTPPKRGSV
jgi:hypothetical protein